MKVGLPNPVPYMSSRLLLTLFSSSLLVLGLACKNSNSGASSGGASGGGSGGGTTPPEIYFDGPTDAAPVSSTSVSIVWGDATNSAGDPPSSMQYDVFRGTSVNMTDEVLVVAGAPSLTSFVDEGLLDDVTYFYRVVARDASGLEAQASNLVSSHLPGIPPTPLDYQTDIEPIWSTIEGSDGVTFCTDCHVDTGTVYGTLSLQSWERLMIGVGTPAKPDTVIVVGDDIATGVNLEEKFYFWEASQAAHNMWSFKRELFLDTLRRWVNEGASEVPDVSLPVFDFEDTRNQSRYSVTNNGDGTVTVTFPHAADPDSEPYRGPENDHLEYRVYGGVDSLNMNWRTPVAIVKRYHFKKTEDFYSISFDWAWDSGVFVVRARDFARNEAINERELEF
jgi:hypothetical protein